MEIGEYVSISNAFRDADIQLKQQKARLANKQYELTQQKNKLQAAQNNKKEYENMLECGAIKKDQYDDAVEQCDSEIAEATRNIQRIKNALYKIKIQVEGVQGQIDVFLDKVKENPEVAKVVCTLKKEKYEAIKAKATAKKAIISEIKGNALAQQKLEELLKLCEKIAKLEEITKDVNANKNSKRYQKALNDIAPIQQELDTKKNDFVERFGWDDKNKKEITKEVLEDILKAEIKVGQDKKISVLTMLDDQIVVADNNIEVANNNIKNVDEEISRNEKQENLEQNEEQENLEQNEPKKQGFFAGLRNFFKTLFERKPKTLSEGEPVIKGQQETPKSKPEQVKEEHQETPEKKQREDFYNRLYVRTKKAKRGDYLISYLVDTNDEKPKQPSNQENDGRGDRE